MKAQILIRVARHEGPKTNPKISDVFFTSPDDYDLNRDTYIKLATYIYNPKTETFQKLPVY